jgi:hypothetical protein
MLSVIMLSITNKPVMLSVIMLNVVMLNVMAPTGHATLFFQNILSTKCQPYHRTAPQVFEPTFNSELKERIYNKIYQLHCAMST